MKTKVILLLDDFSRAAIKTNISELSLYGVCFVNHLEEISNDLLKETKNVVVLEGFLQSANAISDLKLFKNLLGLHYYLLTANDTWAGEFESLGIAYRCDITALSYDLIQGAVFGDQSFSDKNADSSLYNNNVELSKRILKDPASFDTRVQALASEFLANKDYIEHVQEDNTKLLDRMLELETLNARLSNENDRLTDGYKDIMLKAASLNRTLREYETYLTSDIYEKLNIHNYMNKPHIIYIKEFEELVFFNSFLETLVETFRLQAKMSVKVVRLFDASGSHKVSVLPNYYTRIYNSFLTKDIINSDYISKSGDYRELLDILLTNRSGLDLLIIVDSKDFNDIVLSGSMLQLNTCRNVKHMTPLGLTHENTITNSSDTEHFLCWHYFPEFSSFQSKEDQFLFLSSQPVIRQILELSKLFEESI